MSGESLQFIRRSPDVLVREQAIAEGFTPFQAGIIASRFDQAIVREAGSVASALRPGLRAIVDPTALPDIERAASRLADAIIRHEPILVCVDHDSDGVSSAAVLVEGLIQHLGASHECIEVFTTDRLTEGYGLTAGFVERILRGRARKGVVLTADQGSSDAKQIEVLARAEWDCVVTDHHLVPVAGPPAAAYACVNPARADSRFADPLIAGCQVAWLTLWATRIELQRRGVLGTDAPSLAPLLEFTALGTTADCVSFARSLTNRAVTAYGLARMNAGFRPCWASLRRVAAKGRPVESSITARDLGWTFGPRMNAAGRLHAATPGVNLLLARDAATAAHWAQDLDERNTQRREIERELLVQAHESAKQQVARGCRAIGIVFDVGHPGVHGIAASRIAAQYGRPVMCASPKMDDPQTLTASFRSVAGFNIRNALEQIQTTYAPGILAAFGGHAAAAGARLAVSDGACFVAAFDKAARDGLTEQMVGPRVDVDAQLTQAPTLAMLDEIDALEPFGREFDAPLFEVDAAVLPSSKAIGDGTHVRLDLRLETGVAVPCVWFGARGAEAANEPLQLPARIHAAVRLERNRFRGKVSAQTQIVAVADKGNHK